MNIDDILIKAIKEIISIFSTPEKEKVIEILNNEIGAHQENSDERY